jgi:hypothetical protein
MSIFNRRNNIRAKLEPISQSRKSPEQSQDEKEEREPLDQKKSILSQFQSSQTQNYSTLRNNEVF